MVGVPTSWDEGGEDRAPRRAAEAFRLTSGDLLLPHPTIGERGSFFSSSPCINLREKDSGGYWVGEGSARGLVVR